jgi:predicted naringenin-chalcone synthase
LRSWCQEWLGARDVRLSDIDHWAVHPGGPRILTAVESAVGLSNEALQRSRDVLAQFGNMSSATILFILRQMVIDNLNGQCVAMGFGPGLTMEGLLLHR